MLLVCLLALTAQADPTQEVAAVDSKPLPDNVIARIAGTEIPYDWFLHEFRSTYFQDYEVDAARKELFDKFLRKMTLYALAQKEGLTDDPRLRRQIDERVAKQRAYFEYQLDMTEVNAAIQAYLTLHGITPESAAATDVELDAYIEQDVARRQGGPFDVSGMEVPDGVREQYRQRLEKQKHQAAILQHLELQQDLVDVRVNEDAVRNVPPPAIVPAAGN